MKRQTLPLGANAEDTQVVQTAQYNQSEDWLEVSNSGDTMSMSRNNWFHLMRLVARELAEYPITANEISEDEAAKINSAFKNMRDFNVHFNSTARPFDPALLPEEERARYYVLCEAVLEEGEDYFDINFGNSRERVEGNFIALAIKYLNKCSKPDTKYVSEVDNFVNWLNTKIAEGAKTAEVGPFVSKEWTNFDEAARPLMKYLATECHPHTAAIVESTRAQLVEGVRAFNTYEYLKD